LKRKQRVILKFILWIISEVALVLLMELVEPFLQGANLSVNLSFLILAGVTGIFAAYAIMDLLGWYPAEPSQQIEQ